VIILVIFAVVKRDEIETNQLSITNRVITPMIFVQQHKLDHHCGLSATCLFVCLFACYFLQHRNKLA
jgi:hypothetical protein